LLAESEEIRRFRDAVRIRLEHIAADAARDLRDIPPAILLSLLSARGVVLGALISAAIDGVRADSRERPLSPHDLEREIYWRIERVLAAQDQRAAVLRAEIAEVLARNEVSSATGTLSGGYPEVTFLSRADHGLNGTVGQSADERFTRDQAAAAGRALRWDSECPYRGLLPFDQAHAGVFFGRQQLTAELVTKVAGRLAGPSMVVVSGASGAGKSSLLYAGLLPALTAGIQLAGSDRWLRIVMTPTGDPLTELATRLAALSNGDAAAVRNRLAADPDRAHLVVGEAVLDGAARGDGSWPPAAARRGRLLLVIDQFEEVFTLAPGRDAGQQAFIAALCVVASRPSGPSGEPSAAVVIAVRGDFWARCAAHAGLARLMQDGMFVVGPMTATELREAITSPAAAAGLQADADLADTVLGDLRTAGQDQAEGVLPLLSQAMMLTWQRRDGNRLTVPGYQETGGVARSVEFGAEAVYDALPDAGQQIAREIFRALALVGPDGQLGRRAVPRAQLAAGRRDAARGTVDTALEAFASSRLLVLDGDTVQIAHDVLLRAWPRLRAWLDNEQANWILYAQLQEDAARWAEHGRDPSFLYRGRQLAAVEQAKAQWAADRAHYPALTHEQAGFLAASSQQAARGARVRRVALLSLVLLLAISVAAAGVAALADRTANQQRNAALAGQLAGESEALDATNPVAAAALATAAWKIDPTAEARDSLLDVMAQPARGTVTATGSQIFTMTFSADGKYFATTSDTDVAQVWATATHREIGKPLTMTGGDSQGGDSVVFTRDDTALGFHGGADGPSQFWNVTARTKTGPPFQIAGDPIGSGILSPDGKIVATDAVNGAFSLVDAATRRVIGGIHQDGAPIAFSPAGKLLAVQFSDGKGNGWVRLLNVAEHRYVGAPMPGGSSDYGSAVAFSPDGRLIAVIGKDTVTIWDIARHRTIGPAIPVNAIKVAFSPDGKTLATVTPDGVADLWDVGSRQLLAGSVTGHAGSYVLAFSPDGKMLATAAGTTVTLWDIAASHQIGATIPGAASPVVFSPDGRLLAGTLEHGAQIWSLASRRPAGALMIINPHHGPQDTDGAASVAFSPDDKTLATGSADDVPAQLWSVTTHRRTGVQEFSGHNDISAVAFSPDGKLLATSNGSNVWIWDVRTGRVVGRPMFTDDHYSSSKIAFSPDGGLLATIGSEVRLYSVATHRQAGTLLAVGTGNVNDVAFSPDGSIIATASDSGATLWDVATHRQIGAPLTAGEGAVVALAFSPDGTLIATAGQDGSIRLWDVASREQIGPTLPDSNQIASLAFSPDGTLLAAASGYRTRIWGVSLTKNVLNRVCAVAGGSMTPQEWDTYIKSEPFQRTCP
jgi:WD40 repeat protein